MTYALLANNSALDGIKACTIKHSWANAIKEHSMQPIDDVIHEDLDKFSTKNMFILYKVVWSTSLTSLMGSRLWRNDKTPKDTLERQRNWDWYWWTMDGYNSGSSSKGLTSNATLFLIKIDSLPSWIYFNIFHRPPLSW